MLKRTLNAVRRNHALEHATIAVMMNKQGPMRVVGRASPDGFFVWANVTTERLREFATEAETKLILYLKDESNLGSNKQAGLDAVGRLVSEGICVGIKYAVVHQNPGEDLYLASLLKRVDRRWVISGIGERPAISHMRDWGLPGFTTGSGCIAPRLSQKVFEACARKDFSEAEAIRSLFLPLEDLRDALSPAKVLHFAIELAGIAKTGPLIPYLSGLGAEEIAKLAPVAQNLADLNAKYGRPANISE